jgi:hypothetical protein
MRQVLDTLPWLAVVSIIIAAMRVVIWIGANTD